ncbi:MAG TPA: FHA domain-containing serine/threonine-protein kinase [Candidatus Angelobacter sp.]|nr:FHA domain-containing serine/threonine-protein kinase [Candidatus Angelobacter sp.]
MSTLGNSDKCLRCSYRAGAPPDSPLQLLPGTILNDRILIGKQLGQGGFGITYIAYDLKTNQRLAVKEYFPREISTRSQNRRTLNPLNQENKKDLDCGLEKFAEEARLVAGLKDHPGIVSVVDFFHANGTGYIVMEYVDGRTLKQYLKERGGKIAFSEALPILTEVMAALETVHKAGILHRDVNPNNIYIEQDGNVKILDFGNAKQALGEQSRSVSVVLTPGYAPEEQYRKHGHQGPWTDIYSLGATFYRTITGQIPTESLDRMQFDDLVPPSQLNVAISAASEAALMKALAVRAVNRFQTIAQFRHAITPRQQTQSVGLPKKFLLVALISLFVALFAVSTGKEFLNVAEISLLITLFGLMVFMFHRMWKSIQEGKARMTPDKAVAFCFIPLFNLYWAFPVMWGFAVDYNRFLLRFDLDRRTKLPEMLFLLATIVFVATCVVTPWAPGLLAPFSVVNAVLLGVVTAKTCDAVNALCQPERPLNRLPAKSFFLYCSKGENEGRNLELGPNAIVIGRNPKNANLIISSQHVSGTHARVWLDDNNSGIWIEDLNSMNGTFYWQTSAGRSFGWIQLEGSKLLLAGDRFQLGSGEAEFEVRTK